MYLLAGHNTSTDHVIWLSFFPKRSFEILTRNQLRKKTEQTKPKHFDFGFVVLSLTQFDFGIVIKGAELLPAYWENEVLPNTPKRHRKLRKRGSSNTHSRRHRKLPKRGSSKHTQGDTESCGNDVLPNILKATPVYIFCSALSGLTDPPCFCLGKPYFAKRFARRDPWGGGASFLLFSKWGKTPIKKPAVPLDWCLANDYCLAWNVLRI